MAQPAQPKRKWLGDALTFVVAFGLLGAVYLLPADTSLAEIRKIGKLSVCMPDLYAPLVTGDPAEPGFDVELVGLIAERMGLGLNIQHNPAMARDFNPRNWRVTRAQCSLLAGGVALTRPVLSYLDSTDAYLETGWAAVSREPITSLEGQRVGFYAGLNGLDRLALSRQLRAEGIRVRVVNSAADLAKGLEGGSFDVGLSEALTARQLAGEHDWQVAWVDGSGERFPLGIGLWKGDLTLKREITRILADLRAEGKLDALREKYDIADITGALGLDAAPVEPE